MIKAAIAGGAGYTAGELVRILANHPKVLLKYIQSGSHAGELVSKVHRDLLYLPLRFSEIDFSDIDVLFLSVRASAVSYVENRNVDLRILPEVGFSFFGLANLTYGYGIPVMSHRIEEVSRHRVTLTFNLSRNLWRDIFK